MGTITAKHLKQRTGEVIKRVKSGERLTITFRGKPIAIIAPLEKDASTAQPELRPFDKAWEDILQTLDNTVPEFEGWKEATKGL